MIKNCIFSSPASLFLSDSWFQLTSTSSHCLAAFILVVDELGMLGRATKLSSALITIVQNNTFSAFNVLWPMSHRSYVEISTSGNLSHFLSRWVRVQRGFPSVHYHKLASQAQALHSTSTIRLRSWGSLVYGNSMAPLDVLPLRISSLGELRNSPGPVTLFPLPTVGWALLALSLESCHTGGILLYPPLCFLPCILLLYPPRVSCCIPHVFLLSWILPRMFSELVLLRKLLKLHALHSRQLVKASRCTTASEHSSWLT